MSLIRLQLEDRLNRAVAIWRWWDDHVGNQWANRLARFMRSPWWYTLFQLSRLRPISIATRTFWGAKFFCYLPDYFYTTAFGLLRDSSEVHLTRYLIHHLQPGDIFFDVGASCGFYGLLASEMVGDTGQVHGFEPTPEIFKILKRNLAGRSNTVTVAQAVSDTTGTAEFFLTPSFAVKNTLVERRSSKTSLTVATITLDDYCLANQIEPNFIKIDVEGAEDKVIGGAKQILAQTSPVISLEMRRDRNEPHLRAARILNELGYQAYALDDMANLHPISISQTDVDQTISQTTIYTNWIFRKSAGSD